jgi:hypothetical protein
MPSRRSVLTLLSSLAALPLAAGPAAALAGPGAGASLAVRRYGAFYIVNGWILTAADLERLDIHAA